MTPLIDAVATPCLPRRSSAKAGGASELEAAEVRTAHSTVAKVRAPKNRTRVSLDEKSDRSANLFADNGGIAQLVERLVRNANNSIF